MAKSKKKKRVMMIRLGIVIVGIVLLVGMIGFGGYKIYQKLSQPNKQPDNQEVDQEEPETNQEDDVEEKPQYESYYDEQGIFYVDGMIIANKKHGLPQDYNPGEDPEAGNAIRALIAEAQSLGLNISDYYTGYRSYEWQSELYNYYVSIDGQEVAETYSARPGYSEHQTGFAFDLNNDNHNLIGDVTEDLNEINWVKENASRYGFILRYTAENQAITGYMPEPWHLRYVGDRAKAIEASGLSLEEYYGFEGGTEY